MASPIYLTPDGKPYPTGQHQARAIQEDDGQWRGLIVHAEDDPSLPPPVDPLEPAEKDKRRGFQSTTLAAKHPTEDAALRHAQAHADELNARAAQ